jgi:hypothetical protein
MNIDLPFYIFVNSQDENKPPLCIFMSSQDENKTHIMYICELLKWT